MAYDAAAISQKGSKAKTNFRYNDFSSAPRMDAEVEEKVRWDLLPKDIAEVRGSWAEGTERGRGSSLTL